MAKRKDRKGGRHPGGDPHKRPAAKPALDAKMRALTEMSAAVVSRQFWPGEDGEDGPLVLLCVGVAGGNRLTILGAGFWARAHPNDLHAWPERFLLPVWYDGWPEEWNATATNLRALLHDEFVEMFNRHRKDGLDEGKAWDLLREDVLAVKLAVAEDES